MIITEQKPTVEMSKEMESTFFSIGDLGIIFDILRNKLYSNPILATCREICSNARDANRESGVPDEPVQITLPNVIEPTLKISDHGIGISPQRVQDIFVRYGASTKRETNAYTGAFGIGSRSPWSYTDLYSVSTIHGGVKYDYSCVIDETKIGKLVKLNEEATDLPSGTSISIPIKLQDIRAFTDGIEFVCRHWEPKPIIKGGKINWQVLNPILEGSGWKIVSSQGYSRQPRLIIDSIEYPLDLAQLSDPTALRIFYDVQGDVVFVWNTGELSLSASREAVHLDKFTSDKIVAKAKAAYSELQSSLQSKIDNSSGLKEAYIRYAQLQSTIISLPKMEYKGIELETSVYVPYMQEWTPRSSAANPSSWLRFDSYSASHPIYINDLQAKALFKKQISKLFDIEQEGQGKPSKVLIVNSSTQEDDWEAKLQEKVNELHLEELGATYLSEVISLDPEKTPTPRMTVFKLESGKFSRTKYQTFKVDKNTKVLCTLYKNYQSVNRYTKFKGNSFTANQLAYAFDDNSVSIYGLDETVKPDKIKRFFPGCATVDDYVSNKFAGVKERLLKAKAYSQLTSEVANGHWSGLINGLETSNQLTEEIKSILGELKVQQAYATENYNDLRRYEAVMGYIGSNEVEEWIEEHKPLDCGKALDKVFKRYPLLSVLDYYGWRDKLNDIVEYMSLIDGRNQHPAA